jgi:hypothetical protein
MSPYVEPSYIIYTISWQVSSAQFYRWVKVGAKPKRYKDRGSLIWITHGFSVILCCLIFTNSLLEIIR